MNFLDKQSMLFVETADLLTKMARETLVHARLPSFHIPAAVEVLTTGSYNRLPLCIKENLVKPDPIQPDEVESTLARLNQVIQHRLVTSNLLPQMRKFKIDKGRVTFTVPHEFNVSLTMMGDGDVPWRLLEIDILVEDKETGEGRTLVHPLQVNFIHELIQRRLVNNQLSALCEVYNCLHYFCQSIQLEVLYTQTLRLCRDRLDDNIHVEEYVIGHKLTVSYWRELTGSKDNSKSEMKFRITIQADPSSELQVFHLPTTALGLKNSEAQVREKTEQAVKILSMERLLVHTVYFRSLSRLNEIQNEFKTFMKDVDSNITGTTVILTVPVLAPCLRAEQIHITVDTHTGKFQCHIPKYLKCPIMTEMQTCLNGDHAKLPELVSELRYWITKRRCEQTLQHLPAVAKKRLPILTSAEHPATKIGKHKMFVQFYRYSHVILIVGIKSKESNCNEMEYSFYLVHVKPVSVEQNIPDEQLMDPGSAGGPGEMPKMFLRVMQMIEFDSFVATHGDGTCLVKGIDDASIGVKRKAPESSAQPPSKQSKSISPAYFIPELSYVVAMCDEKLPFIALSQELAKRKIPHSGLQIEAHASSSVLNILTLPTPAEAFANIEKPEKKDKDGKELPKPRDRLSFLQNFVTKSTYNALIKRILSISIRFLIPRANTLDRSWMLEFVFNSTPLQSSSLKEQGNRRTLRFLYEMLPTDQIGKTCDLILADWIKIVLLYALVHDFAELYNGEKHNLKNIVSVQSYSYTGLTLMYGDTKQLIVNISWCNELKQFLLVFAATDMSANPHPLLRDQLQSHLNTHYNLAQIVHLLNETYQPMGSIAKLPVLPLLGVPQPKIPVLSFTIIPQSPTLIRIAFQNTYCLEVRLRGGGLVSIRDGAYSRYDRVQCVMDFIPTQGLKGFLSKYVDENAVYRRRSQSEDDNPPSPQMMLEEGQQSSFFRGPQSPRDSGLRFAAPATPPTQSSNPHTPASPHPISQHQGQHSNFNLTSPTTHMPHPSPGFMPSSPLNQPSPMTHTAMSPGPSNLPYIQGHSDSPFGAQMSPAAASAWPGSPIPRPSPRPGQSPDHKPMMNPHHSRILPARSWAAAVPTLLTHEALDTLCRPSGLFGVPGMDLCPLERFLGCVFMKRHLQRSIKEMQLSTAPAEPGVVLFRVDGLQCQVFSNPDHLQTLHIRITPVMPVMQGPQDIPKPQYQWNMEDLKILEQFFEHKVAAPPYRQVSLQSFIKIFSVPPPVLKDLIQIVRLELQPDLCKPMGLNWKVQLCMRSSFIQMPMIPLGTAAVVYTKNKLLFFVSIKMKLMKNSDTNLNSQFCSLNSQESTTIPSTSIRSLCCLSSTIS